MLNCENTIEKFQNKKAPAFSRKKLSWSFLIYFSIFSNIVRYTESIAHDDFETVFKDDVNRREQGQCAAPLRPFTGERHSPLYSVGVLAIRGFPAAFAEFNSTFADYLTAAAGTKFEPPIRFELKPLNFNLLFTDTESSTVDFIYVNPSAYSCIESEFGASSLVSQISNRKVGGQSFDLTQFGGVIFARADSGIETIQDIKGKSVACASISGLGSGQMQFRLLQQAGLSYINDPKQLVFTSNQGKVVNGVLNGAFDIGFVRTDQIERTKNALGELVDASQLRIIEPKQGLNIDGVPFPFESSTQLYAEWNVAALTHVSDDVSREVQSAMLALADHAAVGEELNSCYQSLNCNSNSSGFTSQEACESTCNEQIVITSRRCDTSVSLALIAARAKSEGKYTGWRTTVSYMDLRNMQEETGFIQKNPDSGIMQCVRSTTIYNAITCPPGHFKKSEEEVLNGCGVQNLTCGEGFQCVCNPCMKAFDVDVSPTMSRLAGCAKMSNCGVVQQTKVIQFTAVDNKKRDDGMMKVIIHEGQETRTMLPARNLIDPYMYEFNVTGNKVGILIMEVIVDDEQIPESPLRVEVIPRDCRADTSDAQRIADPDGNCVCIANAVQIGSTCASFSTLFPSIIIPIAAVIAVVLYLYIDMKRKQADSVWAVKPSELLFDDPVEIIGRGTFGLVLLGEYRGTQVAVKRVIPPRAKDKKTRRNSILGSGDSNNAISSQNTITKEDIYRARRRASSVSNAGSLDLELGEETKTNGHQNPNPPPIQTRRLSLNSKEHRETWRSSFEMKIVDDQKIQSGLFGLKSGANWSVNASKNGSQDSTSFGRFRKRIVSGDEYTRLKNDFMVEMRHLSKLRHPCITTVMGAVVAKKEEPMLVMEYMDHGSLYDLLHNQTIVIEGELVLPILRDIAQGVRFLHAAEPQVIHGDLKAQNILVDSKFRAKVADFGLSQKKQIGATGTPLWMAPELLRGESENTAMSDVYSFGIILYEVYSRQDPYQGEDHGEVLKLVADPVVNKRPPVPQCCPPTVAAIMKECLEKTPGSRPTFEQLDLRLKDLDVATIEPGQVNFSYQQKKLAQAERSEELLFDVFPKHIAEAIRDGRKVDPESRQVVTIFFSDIVGFTNISSTLSALKVSDMLDRLYIQFDDLSRKHDVFKVETIGDAYMAVTNLVKDQPDHAKRIAMFSIDALKVANDTPVDLDDPSKGVVNIRVGFHSGPVVANVVGTRNPRYCLFGDTVNTASRMESNSLANRIQCSSRAKYFVHRQCPELPIRPRGKISIKGKGEMRTYWINEERTPSCAASINSVNSVESNKELGVSQRTPRQHHELDLLTSVGEED